MASADTYPRPAGEPSLALRRLLPIAQLLLSAVLLFPYRGPILFQLFGFRVNWGVPVPTIVRNPDGTIAMNADAAFDRWFRAKENAFDLVSALNLPAVVVDLPYALASDDHGEWSPAGIDYKTWRVVTWPVVTLPLWWIAGRGLEALFAAKRKMIQPRIGWATTIISFLLMAGGMTLSIGFLFSGNDRADRQFQVFIAGAAIWGVLGSFTVAARLAQWRIKKQAPLGLVSQSP